MSLTSYAQNFEDVILWRALKHVGRGFYIDVGAQDPIVDSVSLAFYENGWRGAHVEPAGSYAEKLRSARPDEDVIQSAIGSSPRPITFWEFRDTGLSTGEATIAAQHEARGFESKVYEVPCIRLSELLDRYMYRDIHWLKVDVEGAESDVLASWPPSSVRPWVVVVESTRPATQEVSHADWEGVLIDLGYDFVYFDGLNRFYVSHNRPELKSAFGPGPNLFDDAMLSGLNSSPFPFKLNALNQELQRQVERSGEQLEELRAQLVSERVANRRREAKLERKLVRQFSEVSGIRGVLQEFAVHTARVKALEGQLDDRDQRLSAQEKRLAAEQTENAEVVARLSDRISLLTKYEALYRDAAAQISALSLKVDTLHKSTSWRVTAPLRSVRNRTRGLTQGLRKVATAKPGSRLRKVMRALIVWFGRPLYKSPAAMSVARRVLSRFPTARSRLAGIVASGGAFVPPLHISADNQRGPTAGGSKNVEVAPTVESNADVFVSETSKWYRGARIHG